jgi:2,4-dienoyl-CoA reductase-like NADH-dependent reductase (Old Yellow Enzyme family)
MAATAILGAPGLYNDSQIVGWKQVTDAVHAKGGTIFLQLYHAGRQSNSQLQPGGGAPVGPSEVLHGGVDGDDRRHAVRSLVGHGGSHRANHYVSAADACPNGASRPATSSRFSWPR